MNATWASVSRSRFVPSPIRLMSMSPRRARNAMSGGVPLNAPAGTPGQVTVGAGRRSCLDHSDDPLVCVHGDRRQCLGKPPGSRRKECLRIGHSDQGVEVTLCLDGHVARQQQADGRLRRDGGERKRWIAGAKNCVWAKVAAELVFEGRLKIDLREHTEPLGLSTLRGPWQQLRQSRWTLKPRTQVRRSSASPCECSVTRVVREGPSANATPAVPGPARMPE